ncbi:DUF1304 domain-containing protein [Bacillus velezensis]|uniref:DUF1304 domain-containing protein n=1 Tax=Bacillus velezensis TaxID=492670 RepID=UPI0030CD9EB3
MDMIAAVFVGIVALEHVFIMILEMFFINSKAAKRSFKLPKHLEGDRNVAVMFANQGLYNGFLTAGLIWGLILADPVGHMIQMFFVICVVIAAIFGGFTSNKSIIVKQGLPAVLALIFLLLA